MSEMTERTDFQLTVDGDQQPGSCISETATLDGFNPGETASVELACRDQSWPRQIEIDSTHSHNIHLDRWWWQDGRSRLHEHIIGRHRSATKRQLTGQKGVHAVEVKSSTRRLPPVSGSLLMQGWRPCI